MRYFLIFLLYFASSSAVTVKTNKGKVEGYTSYDAGLERPVHVFKAVPFAEPPVGDLRFALPQDALPWEGVINTTEYSPACMSNTTRTRSPQENISEDCLYLNIFADKRCFANRTYPCPIIAYIHGGSFTYDSAVMFNDTRIIQKYASHEIIFVIPAFRLGIFGFLDLGNDDVVQRNIGMYDIIKSLKWIKEEIGSFGGDPNSVTLMGNSAGASSVAYLMLSPGVPDDAFHQGISLSNAPDLASNSNQRLSQLMIDSVGCNESHWTTQEMVHCLKGKSALELIGWQRELESAPIQSFSGPTKNTPLFPGSYSSLLRGGKAKPIILGTTKYEFTRSNDDSIEYKKTYCDFYCRFFEYHTTEAYEACLRFYLNETGMYSGEYSLEGEAIHALNYRDAVVWESKGAPVYLSSFNLNNHSIHARDMLFAIGLHPVAIMTEEEKFMDKYYPALFRNFVKRGQPDKKWKPLGADGKGYFVIDVIKNGSEVILPHQTNAYYYPDHVHFWLSYLSSVNEKALEAGNKTEDSPLISSLLFPAVNNQLPLETESKMEALEEENESLLSAFWVVVVIALILAAAILVMIVANQINPKLQKGYNYAEEMEIFGNTGKAGIVVYGATN
ncbi:hypothetical protein QR680_017943 [Steinernema hermaphroditum]|uniref:Carboxylic ester hydrolase n=1 Tax=Steinernema hermaphroditum TaxID=289476 RepID=A0AA39HIG3_9BILA|nr:hypothetical protein QR680_017943 [Steinernema hermaphroditum]